LRDLSTKLKSNVDDKLNNNNRGILNMAKNHRVRLIWDKKQEQEPVPNEVFEIEYQYIFPKLYSEQAFPNWEPEVLPQSILTNGRLIQGNNLDVLHMLKCQDYQNKIDLIYIDPPYLSQNRYSAKIKLGENSFWQPLVFKDEGQESLDSYLNDLYIRLKLMKELLSERGSIFVHLDWHVSHYVKILLDEIFGVKNFINEIVWCYGGGSGSKHHFHRKHDLIFWYSRSDRYIFNPQFRPYSEGTIQRGLTKVKGSKYKLHQKGALMQDWWTDINKILSPTAEENLKFPTQKPRALLDRIIATASNPGSLVADFYSGSGTTAEVCEKQGRKWIICDSSFFAITTSIQRLVKVNASPFTFECLSSSISQQNDNLQIHLKTQIYNNKYRLLNIEILKYVPLHEVEVRKNLSLQSQIQFWELDLDYQGNAFCSHLQIIREKIKWDDLIPIAVTVLIHYKEHGVIAVRIYDIYGDCYTKLLYY
jgi:site-specific DNA-methyltransferase (adenine-specific)